jgi:hypothetical protein
VAEVIPFRFAVSEVVASLDLSTVQRVNLHYKLSVVCQRAPTHCPLTRRSSFETGPVLHRVTFGEAVAEPGHVLPACHPMIRRATTYVAIHMAIFWERDMRPFCKSRFVDIWLQI